MNDHEFIPDDALDAERSRVEAILGGAGVHLDDPALWIEPPEALESTVLTGVGRRRGRRLAAWLGAAAAVVVAAAVGLVVRSPAPDWQATLNPTDAAPGAHAIASGWNQEAGTLVRLEIEGLGPAPEGFVYELWFSSEDAHVSAGTFRTAEGAELSVGVSRAQYPRVWITLEPLDDDPGPAVNLLDTGA